MEKSKALKQKLAKLEATEIPETMTRAEQVINALMLNSEMERLKEEIKQQEYIEKVKAIQNGK